MCPSCDDYRDPRSDPNEAGRETSADAVNLNELLEQHLLWGQAWDANDVTKETFASAIQLIWPWVAWSQFR